MRHLFFLLTLIFASSLNAQTTTISGLAPAYVGKSIEVYTIADYFSFKENLLASSTVSEDSTFSFTFNTSSTKKVIIRSNNNHGFLYIQPNGKYNIFLPEKNAYDPYRPTGNNVEIGFFDLDSSDINYKILGFQRWLDDFTGKTYFLKSRNATEYVDRLDRFKNNVEKAYKADTTTFFKTYVRYSIAGLDNVSHAAERNRFEKHDFYIKYSPVSYENDAYMQYIRDFYQKMIPRLNGEVNNKVYAGVLKSSPTAIMKALGKDYTLINLRIREMIMLNALAETYHKGEFPQTNILQILDSVSERSLFKANGIIAKNLRDRLTELTPGMPAPDFVLTQTGMKTKTLLAYNKKYLYIHFADPNNSKSINQVVLLKALYEKYSEHVEFVTVYKDGNDLDSNGVSILESCDWDVYALSTGNSMWNRYRINAYPQYILIDPTGHIVASPALGPTPNGEYKTIDKTFFEIRKRYLLENDPDKGNFDPRN